MANPQNLRPFPKGVPSNPNGRPKKYVTLLREQGYKTSEVNDTIQVLLQMSLEELKDVYSNPKATVLEKIVANALKRSLEKGSLYSVETLLTRVFGAPIQNIKQQNQNINLNYTVSVIKSDIQIPTSEGEVKL